MRAMVRREYRGRPGELHRLALTGYGVSDEVKWLSPYHRLVIELHSPDGLGETGLLICPPEKKMRNLAGGVESDIFSRPV
jgi:hypothetical protein